MSDQAMFLRRKKNCMCLAAAGQPRQIDTSSCSKSKYSKSSYGKSSYGRFDIGAGFPAKAGNEGQIQDRTRNRYLL